MKIAYLAWHGSVHTRRWVAWFAARGHEVHVVTCGGGAARDVDADGRPVELTYEVHDLGEPRAGKLGYLLKVGAARRAVRALEPDVVHAHWLTSYGLLALAVLRGWKSAPPLAVTAHGDDVLIAPRSRALRPIVQRVLRAAQLVTVPSDVMAEAALELIRPNDPPRAGIAVFQYGVETARLAEVGRRVRAQRDPRGSSADDPLRIVSARALLDLYRIDALIEAVALLRERGVHVQCHLLGDGPSRASLEAQVERLALGALVTFHGAVTPGEVERVVAASDAYVSVSESDGVSLALLEALALGAVPVLSDIPANRPWVNDGETGVLVAIEPASIADGIVRAGALDRERLAADNLAMVGERADRDTNLAACELLLDSLVGVSWNPEPVDAAPVDPT
ncbi:MAG: glycosyl transferase family 1 [Thermoleophilia bacterium]|nr:glycosyl transferase family 1 [Thermoleophilia bacterium]